MRQETLKEMTLTMVDEVLSRYNDKRVTASYKFIKREMTERKEESRVLSFCIGNKEMRVFVNYLNLKDNEMPTLNGMQWVMLKVSHYDEGQLLGVVKDFFIPFNKFYNLIRMAHSNISVDDVHMEVKKW